QDLRALAAGQRLQRQVSWPEGGAQVAHVLGSEVLVCGDGAGGKRYLCVVQPAPATGCASQHADPRQTDLLHELQTILESSPAGTAYVRGSVLVRCNRRF